MKTGLKSRQLTLLGLLSAVLLVFAFTPLGYLNIGPLAITFNMIPVAVAAVALGPVGGAVTGAVFGMTSFLQCIGIGGTSAMGVILFEINPLFAFVQRFVPRLAAGWLVAWIYRGVCKAGNRKAAAYAAGFCAAFLNTALFMAALVGLFGDTPYVQGLISGRNVLVFICSFVGVNAVAEMIVSTLIVGVLCSALERAHLLRR